MLDHAHDLDSDMSDGTIAPSRALKLIAREATNHGMHARITGGHVLVTSPEGATLATRSAVRLAAFLGY